MRIFDVFGAIFVVLWLTLVGAFAFFALGGEERGLSLTGGKFDLQEGTFWMSVHQGGEDAGVLREVRTRLIDGWLIELRGAMELPLLQKTYGLRFDTKTILTEDLMLRSALGTMEAMGMTLKIDAQVEEREGAHQIRARISLDDATEDFTLPLDTRPMLASHGLPQMLASEELSPGSHLDQQFFDPMTLSPTTIRLTYEGRESIEHYGETYDAHRFVQKVSGMDALTYADDHGEVIRQAMPFGLTMGRIPDFLGNQLLRQTLKELEERDDEPPAFLRSVDAQALLSLVGLLGGGQRSPFEEALAEGGASDDEDHQDPLFRFHEIPSTEELHLESPRQRVRTQLQGRLELETDRLNNFWHEGLRPGPARYEAKLSQPPADASDLFRADQPPSPKALVDLLPEHCQKLPRRAPDWPDLHEEPPPEGPLFCLLSLADALSAAGHPPHFVHGLYRDGAGEHHLHVWLAIYSALLDGDGPAGELLYIEVDPLQRGGQVGARHLQLQVRHDYEPKEARALFEELRLLDPHDIPLSEALKKDEPSREK